MSGHTLQDKVLVMIVGPSAVGKSTLMNEMAKANHNFAYVHSFTTRSPRPGEQSYYNFINRVSAEELHRRSETITYFEHPTTHDLYGTTIESYPGKYNLLDTLSNSVSGYRKLSFERTVTIALTAPANEWQNWFLSRYPEPSPEAEKRLEEAMISINWALRDAKTHWLVNTEGDLARTAEEAIDITLNPPSTSSAPPYPRDMLRLIEQGIWS